MYGTLPRSITCHGTTMKMASMLTLKVRTMTSQEAQAVLEDLQEHCAAVCEIAKVANRNGKSLGGHNHYGERFHKAVIALSKAEAKLGPVLIAVGLDNDESEKLSGFLDKLKSPRVELRQRNEVVKALRMTCQATILPAVERLTANPFPETEQVLPIDVVRPTRRKYIERVVLQANG